MGEVRPRPLVLDAGALIALERGDRRVVRLLELAGEIHVPAAVVGQVWRNPARQVRIVRLLAVAEVDVDVLDAEVAKAAGQLCGASGTSDVIDATVVLAAKLHDAVIVSSDEGDLRRIDPAIDVVRC